jgi:outer membrane protein with beta-barrel domain
MGMLRTITLAAVVALVLSVAARAEETSTPAGEGRSTPRDTSRFDDTGRLYLLLQTGFVFLYDDEFAGDTHYASHEFTGSNHINVPIGVSLGYNLTKHFGLELEGLGTEPDVRSDSLGKLAEYSNITVFGSLRYRYPLGDGRFVPWVLGGVGWSLNDLNDTANPRIKLTGDGSTIAGTVALGFDYFLAEDVAVGVSAQQFIYPSIDTEVFNKDTGQRQRGSANLTGMGLLAHIRMYLGQQAAADGSSDRKLLWADHGPYDTAERRYYLFAMAGDQIFFDDNFGGGATVKSPGSANWSLGGGLGVNLDEHWGVEVSLANTDVNINDSSFGKIGEMSNFTVLPTARFRWQFLGGRLVPFATLGIGATFNRPNDPRNSVDVYLGGTQRTPKFDIQRTGFAASVGVGLEYFLNRHISVALLVPLNIYPDWDTSLQQRSPSGAPVGEPVHSSWNYTGIAPSVRLTAYAP